jgi:endogenous inhibitor of DNA gyrase (YacG/DUF329 family)
MSLVALNCPNCGAPIKAEQNATFIKSGESFVYSGSASVQCGHCKTQFASESKQKGMSAFNQAGQKVFGNQFNIGDINGSTGVVIGNNATVIVQNDFVGRDKIVYGDVIKGDKIRRK